MWRKIKKLSPNRKHRGDYPAVKIGRLGVYAKFQGQGYGKKILDLIKHTFVTNNRTGRCFITADAYRAAEQFYVNNGFKRLSPNKNLEKDDTILMYYNLQELIG
ncbi:hypothetical protein FACS1894159_05020 [Bacteroidia bacterium]|nr:hypothetical protein FACS1894159_05020 [Bacteroidia bacterium]